VVYSIVFCRKFTTVEENHISHNKAWVSSSKLRPRAWVAKPQAKAKTVGFKTKANNFGLKAKAKAKA